MDTNSITNIIIDGNDSIVNNNDVALFKKKVFVTIGNSFRVSEWLGNPEKGFRIARKP